VLPGKDDPDFRPRCRKPFKIIAVRFGFRATRVVAACPNCTLVCRNDFHSPTCAQSLPEQPNDAVALWEIGRPDPLPQPLITATNCIDAKFKFVRESSMEDRNLIAVGSSVTWRNQDFFKCDTKRTGTGRPVQDSDFTDPDHLKWASVAAFTPWIFHVR
jgi:hypothetical protein